MGFKILAFWVFVVLLTCSSLGIIREKDPYILAMYYTPLFPAAPSEFWGQGFGVSGLGLCLCGCAFFGIWSLAFFSLLGLALRLKV